MVTPKIIKTEADYQTALARIDELMETESDTPEADELELLVALVDMYEEQQFPIDPPDPIEAIKFRMEQSGLRPVDLAPYLGGKSKVSEVLNKKRPLTLSMIRALHAHLGIPAEVLLQEPGSALPSEIDLAWTRFPLREMANYGWIPNARDIYSHAEELMRDFIVRAGGMEAAASAVFRKNEGGRKNAKTDPYALRGWLLRVIELASKTALPQAYQQGVVTGDFLARVGKLSLFQDGPRLAKEYLANHGIHLVIVPHLKKTYLDGAAMLLSSKTPVIGMTLRYDRIDNFWFTLLHELAHIMDIFSSGPDLYVDDMTLRNAADGQEDETETKADQAAEDALIPHDIWMSHPAGQQADRNSIMDLAGKLEIHPAVIAGRIRYERRNYRLLSRYVGQGEVRRCFEGSIKNCA